MGVEDACGEDSSSGGWKAVGKSDRRDWRPIDVERDLGRRMKDAHGEVDPPIGHDFWSFDEIGRDRGFIDRNDYELAAILDFETQVPSPIEAHRSSVWRVADEPNAWLGGRADRVKSEIELHARGRSRRAFYPRPVVGSRGHDPGGGRGEPIRRRSPRGANRQPRVASLEPQCCGPIEVVAERGRADLQERVGLTSRQARFRSDILGIDRHRVDADEPTFATIASIIEPRSPDDWRVTDAPDEGQPRSPTSHDRPNDPPPHRTQGIMRVSPVRSWMTWRRVKSPLQAAVPG